MPSSSTSRHRRVGHLVQGRFKGILVAEPGIAATPHLREEGVGVAVDGRFDNAIDIDTCGERRPERVHPIRAIFGTRLVCVRTYRGGKKRDRDQVLLHWTGMIVNIV